MQNRTEQKDGACSTPPLLAVMPCRWPGGSAPCSYVAFIGGALPPLEDQSPYLRQARSARRPDRNLDQALLRDQAPWAFADSSTKLKRRSASNQSTSGDPTGHPGAVPDSALNSSSAPVGNVIFSFPRQVLNPTKSVVAGYQGVNCLKQSPRVSFDLLGGTVHGNECRATLRLRQVLIRVGSSVPKSRDNHLIRNPHNPSGSQ
jgi:hypothetical protein